MMDTFEPLTETDISSCRKGHLMRSVQLSYTSMACERVSACSDKLNYKDLSMKAPLVTKPISDVAFLSKTIERGVTFCLQKYIVNNNFNESLESAYKQ